MLVACDEDGAERLNHFARTALRAAGRIGGPSVTAGRLDVAAGDRVVIGTHSAGGPALRPGGIADVRLVDPDGAWVVLDLPTAGTVRLSGAALERAGLHYAYAVVLPARRVTGRLHAVSPAHLGPELDLG